MFANFIGGQYVAGIVYIFQELGMTSQGFISHIDYTTGEIRLGGDPNDATSGIRLVINDPGISWYLNRSMGHLLVLVLTPVFF